VEKRHAEKVGEGWTLHMSQEYVDSLNINEKQLILTTSKIHKHERSVGKDMYEVSQENKLSSVDLME